MSIFKNPRTETYTPLVGEKGFVYIDITMSSYQIVHCNDHGVDICENEKPLYTRKLYSYEKTSSTAITINEETSSTLLGPVYTAHSYGCDGSGNVSEAEVVNNSGSLEVSGIPDGGGNSGSGLLTAGSGHDGDGGYWDDTLTDAIMSFLVMPTGWGELEPLASELSGSGTLKGATRPTVYYVGNAGSPAGWNNDSYWSNTSGGIGGYGVPATSIAVFDANSPDCTLDVALDSDQAIELDCSAYTGELDFNDFNIAVQNDVDLSSASASFLFKSGQFALSFGDIPGGIVDLRNCTINFGTSTVIYGSWTDTPNIYSGGKKYYNLIVAAAIG